MNEYLKLKNKTKIDNSVKFQRKMLMAGVTGLEFLNNKFDPFSIKLDGWSESVNDNIFDYDEILKIMRNYDAVMDIAPEIRLIFALGGSAFMFHLQNTMFKSSLPGMDDGPKTEILFDEQFASAAVGSMDPILSGDGGDDDIGVSLRVPHHRVLPPGSRTSFPSDLDLDLNPHLDQALHRLSLLTSKTRMRMVPTD